MAFACPHAPRRHRTGHVALTTLHHYYETPDFSLRIGGAFRDCLIAPPTPPALRPHAGGMNTLIEDATRSPQVRRSSVPPCRPHTPCVSSTLHRYLLRPKAAGSDQRAHGRPVRRGFRLGYGPEV